MCDYQEGQKSGATKTAAKKNMLIQAELKAIHTEMRFVIANSGSNLDFGLPFLRSR